jgi:hypothetical protein
MLEYWSAWTRAGRIRKALRDQLTSSAVCHGLGGGSGRSADYEFRHLSGLPAAAPDGRTPI